MEKVYLLYVHLADNEWGNDVMHRVATELLRSKQYQKPLVVEVHEHGGWWLQYTLAKNGEVMVVGTANDGALFQGEAMEFRKKAAKAEIVYAGNIRREVENPNVKVTA